MTKDEILKELEAYGNENTKKVLLKHGAKEPFFGVKVQDLKKIQKKIKKDYELSLELYETGNSDAMYLAGLIADEQKMSKADLQNWVEKAYWYYISEYTVPWISAESAHALELALEWIESDKETIASAGWSTLANILGIKANEDLDEALFSKLLARVGREIHSASNRVRYTMNAFIIALGSAMPNFTEKAIQLGKKIGKVSVEMGGTACKVPFAPDYIKKVKEKGKIAHKKKMARC